MEKLINEVLKLAKKSEKKGEFPVGAIIYSGDKIVSKAYNTRNKSNKTIDHAEITAIIRANKKLHTWRLNGYNMIVTLEPCDMCRSIIRESRLDEVTYLIDRYEYKKQYGKTKFNKLKINDCDVENYKTSIRHFFENKR